MVNTDKKCLLSMQKRLLESPSLKAVQILEALSYVERYWGIRELGEMTGLNTSTIHRILQELVANGYVAKDEAKKMYRIGFATKALAMRFNTTNYLVDLAQNEMRHLNDLSTETIHLIALDSFQGIYIGKLEAKNQIGLRSKVGKQIPLYCTGGGKAILAFQTVEWIGNYMNQVNRHSFTDNTIVGEQAFLKEMEIIRIQGFAIDNKEHNPDIVCVAAPIFNAAGKVVCSIGISAPDYRFSLEKALLFSEEVRNSAQRISTLLRPYQENVTVLHF